MVNNVPKKTNTILLRGGKNFFCFAVAAILFIGCATHQSAMVPVNEQLGIPVVKWNGYSQEKQQALMQAYQQVMLANQEQDKKSAELAMLVQSDAASVALPSAASSTTPTTPSVAASSSKLPVNSSTPPAVAPRHAIQVKISDGQALMPPFISRQPFFAVTFTLSHGACQNIDLVQLDRAAQTSLRACYKNRSLKLDPSRYELDKQDGTMSIPYSPLWTQEQGFTYYGINSSGFVKLKNVTVTIRTVN